MMPTAWCPRCSGEIQFADQASDETVERCSVCGVRISLGAYKLLEWSDDFGSRLKAVDWSGYENGEGRRDVDFRYALAFRLGQLVACVDEAMPFVERALFRAGRPLPIAEAA